ncbi:Tau-tubulin kinase 1 [Bagarius yarrelli]|uniref:Tau-tubulin kinase 1 n=1 Tax=Bagarius yarrelli TaxID=175774 RepID=A0A556VW27_BAGYA|nr:Tau-tubulin kinase 1 [Bagarius yarrelli]
MDHRTKALLSEKEMFHILPKLQSKRADFLTLMLTGSLHQCRGFMATPPDTQADGPREDDVTKSESDSLDQSQDGPPSTLLAMDPQKEAREPGSIADVDLDQEDVSKTLVLFSPGDMRKSLNSGDPLQSEKEAAELQTCLLEKNQQPSTKTCDAGTVGLLQQKCDPLLCAASTTPVNQLQKHQPAQKPAENQNLENEFRIKQESNRQQLSKEQLDLSKEKCFNLDDPGISSIVRRKSNSSATTLAPSASAASPPFTKVERTFIHVSETTHLNIMSSRASQGQGHGPELSEDLQRDVEPRPKPAPILMKAEGIRSKNSTHTLAGIRGFKVVDVRVQSRTPAKMDVTVSPIYIQTHRHVLREFSPEKPKNQLQRMAGQNRPGENGTSSRLKGRSRIPILVSEDRAAADPSPSPDPTPKHCQQRDFTRVLLERRRRALNSRTSSSISSEDEPRKVSETLSTAEEDTHQSDDSIGKVKQEASGWGSRIPRPVTPVDRAPTKLLLKCVQSGVSVRSKSALSRPASPRTPLRCVLTTSRSLHSTHRTHSPSPQRTINRIIRSQTNNVTQNPNPTKATSSVKHTTKGKQKHNTTTDR